VWIAMPAPWQFAPELARAMPRLLAGLMLVRLELALHAR
jgi:hypothetical protein